MGGDLGGKSLKITKSLMARGGGERGTGDSRELPHLSLSASSMGRNDALL